MEGELEGNKMPLLEGWKLTGSGRESSRRFSRRDSFRSLRHDFLSRLPDKVIKSCVIDSEASSIINNISKSSDLTKGNYRDCYAVICFILLSLICMILLHVFCMK